MADVTARPSKIVKWGNSAAVRLASSALDAAQMQVTDPVDVIATEGEIIIRRRYPKVTMAELLAKFDPDKHRRDLILDDAPVGKETL
jgi:antitoxin MazE